MFPLTRPVRQAIATVVLLGLTVVPTGLVIAFAWRVNRPGHVRDVEIDLGRQLGLQVTLTGVRYPRPGEVVYQGIVLRQEEPRGKKLVEIARADQARLERTDQELTLQLENARLRCESPNTGLAQMAAFLQRSGQVAFERINVAAPACELDLGGDSLKFPIRDLAGVFVVDPAAPSLKVAYRVPGAGAGTRCELTLTRDRRTDQIETSLVFKTVEGMPLPSRVLNVFFDAEDWLGRDAKVDGTVSLRQEGASPWEANFQGDLLDVDLGRVIGRRFPRHRLTGRARVTIKQARWGQRANQGPGWVDVEGELLAGQGSIGLDLVGALTREMRFRQSARLANIDPRKTEVDFRALGFSFAMKSSGEIQITGALGAEFAPETVVAGPTTALLSAPLGSASVHGLIKTLFPVSQASSSVLVPHTAESQILLSLPIPASRIATTRQTVDGN
jgi:hypothetical protein